MDPQPCCADELALGGMKHLVDHVFLGHGQRATDTYLVIIQWTLDGRLVPFANGDEEGWVLLAPG